MATLANYNHFDGYYWETASITNALNYQGFTVPQTGQPYTESLLMGISGGQVFAHFAFSYDGVDPHVRILTRNTFDPFTTILDRMGIARDVIHTTKPEKAAAKLIDIIENGEVPIVLADMFSLPYNALKTPDMWAMMPIIVYGLDDQIATIADRANLPLQVTVDELHLARAKVKKDKFRIITLQAPNPDKLTAAIRQGIWDCIKLYAEKPPRGSAKNFGFKAYDNLIEKLTKPTSKQSWEKVFPQGGLRYAGLKSLYDYTFQFGKSTDTDAERALYAQFLDEASAILNKPDLTAVADQFRQSAQAWRTLADTVLSTDVPLLHQTRQLLDKRHRLFLECGDSVTEALHDIDAELDDLRQQADHDTQSAEDAQAHLNQIAAAIAVCRDIEQNAISDLTRVMSS